MNKKFYIVYVLIIFFLINAKQESLQDGLYTVIKTQRGDIILKLYYEKAPLSVANFVGLAEGTIKNNKRKRGVPFFDNLTFHRVVKNFVIQTGDPTGTGNGDPGYSYPIEINKDLKHNTPGTLGIAREDDPNTNGSQFYITHIPTPYLDGSYIVFGRVVKGMDTVNKIQKGDKLISVRILRIGKKAKKYTVNDDCFNRLRNAQFEKNRKAKMFWKKYIIKRMGEIKNLIPKKKFVKLSNGIKYLIVKKGNGEKIIDNKRHKCQYFKFTIDGKKIESSYLKGVPFLFKLKSTKMNTAMKSSLSDMRIGEKRIIVSENSGKKIIYELELLL